MTTTLFVRATRSLPPQLISVSLGRMEEIDVNLIQLRHLLLILTAAVVFTASAARAGNAPAKNATANSNANAAKPVAAAPTADALLALDKKANEAYIKGDGRFFEGFLSDKVVMRDGGARLSKTDAVKMISGVKCEVKEGWACTSRRQCRDNRSVFACCVSRQLRVAPRTLEERFPPAAVV